MADYTLEILTTNYSGQIADIVFNPCSGGTINLGNQLLPYNYVSEYIYGEYELTFSAYGGSQCFLSIPCPSPTPTPTQTMTETPTNTPTNTPTVTPTNTMTPTPSPVFGKPYTLKNGISANGDLFLTSGSGISTTDPNAIFSGGSNGTIAFAQIDNLGVNEFSYFNPIILNEWFKLTMTQGLVSASMSGTPFAMQYQVGTPNLWFWGGGTGIRPGQMGLVTPATDVFTINQTVNIIAEPLDPEPLVQLLVYSTNKNISDLNITGTTITLDGGSYPVQRLIAGYAWNHNNVPVGGLSVTITGSGSMTLTCYKNGVIVDQLNNVTPVYPYTRNYFADSWLPSDQIKITLEG